ncbi:MAG: hypothetical protein RLY31_275 [Bacteroidota bacterium]|jgi:hypothetical protein
MKKFSLLLSMTALMAFAAFAQSTEGPVMKFESTEVDYGEILQDSEPLRVFKFTNTGNAPLIISNAKGSCGCTVPSYPKDPILPGETGNIEVRYDTKRIGPFQKTVTLTTNEATPTHTLKIKGKVNPKPSEESVPAGSKGLGGR